MKILIVTQYFYPERFTINDIAFKLCELGHDVTVLTGKPNYGYEQIIPEYKNIKYEEINKVKVHRVNLYPRKKSRCSIIKNYLSFWFNSSKYVNKLDKDFDVVLSVCLSPIISCNAAAKYAKKYNVKHVHYCLDLWPESTVVTGAIKKNSLLYKFLFNWSKKLYNTATKIIVSSPSFIPYLRDYLKINCKEYTFIPQPAMLPKVIEEPIKYTNKYNIVYCGNIGTIQLVDKFVLAMKNLSDLDIKLHLIGMGRLQDKINDLIKENGLEDKIEYLGPKQIEEATRYYYNADALLVGLKNDDTVGKTIPSKLTQYLYFKRPILGVLSGDGKDMLIDAKGSIVVDEDIKSIEDGIRKIVSLSEKEKKTMGENNYNYFKNNLTIDEIVKKIIKELN